MPQYPTIDLLLLAEQRNSDEMTPISIYAAVLIDQAWQLYRAGNEAELKRLSEIAMGVTK